MAKVKLECSAAQLSYDVWLPRNSEREILKEERTELGKFEKNGAKVTERSGELAGFGVVTPTRGRVPHTVGPYVASPDTATQT